MLLWSGLMSLQERNTEISCRKAFGMVKRKRFTALWMVHCEQPCSLKIEADVFQLPQLHKHFNVIRNFEWIFSLLLDIDTSLTIQLTTFGQTLKAL